MKPSKYGLVYLATVYRKYPEGIEKAFEKAAQIAGRMFTQGYKVFSPISHGHPMSVHGGVDPLLDIWLQFDEAMMKAADTLFVATMPRWNESTGIAHEINFFTNAGKPIYKIDPDTLKVTK